MEHRSAAGVARRTVERIGARRDDFLIDPPRTDRDAVAVEEPLEIRVDGEPVVTTMRTPGADVLLALGFLFAEGIVRSIDEVGAVVPCWRPGEDAAGNVIEVQSGPGVRIDPERVFESRRLAAVSSAWGVCGRRSVEALVDRWGTLDPGPEVSPEVVVACVDELRGARPALPRFGGAHAAAAFTASGRLLAAHEDVGRHNAVDKVVGELLSRRLIGEGSAGAGSERPALLVVSGRLSFEIVQKAAAARLPVVASVSAASSLAIDLAAAAHVTLAAFVRGGALSVYAHPERLSAPSAPRARVLSRCTPATGSAR